MLPLPAGAPGALPHRDRLSRRRRLGASSRRARRAAAGIATRIQGRRPHAHPRRHGASAADSRGSTTQERATLYVPALLPPNLFLNVHPDYVNAHMMFPTGPESVRIVYDWLFEPRTCRSRTADLDHYVALWESPTARMRATANGSSKACSRASSATACTCRRSSIAIASRGGSAPGCGVRAHRMPA